jgi:hemoglobin
MSQEKPEILTRGDVQTLVDQFYARVNQDPLLSPVFNDFAKVDWAAHLPKMYSFWSSILLEEYSYKGRPFPPHALLPAKKVHYDRWLKLFSETVDSLFVGEKAEMAKLRAQNLASIFMSRLGLAPEMLPITAPDAKG